MLLIFARRVLLTCTLVIGVLALPGAGQASAAGWCTGTPNQNLDAARQNFKEKCGESWDAQRHQCDYKSDGFHCHGNTSGEASSDASPGPATPAPSTSGSSDGWCTGTPNTNISRAKSNFADSCGRAYNDQVGDKCDWKSDGWHCSGNQSDAAEQAPPAPTVTQTRWNGQVVHVSWSSVSGARSYEVYVNGTKMLATTTNRVGYVDSSAPSNNKRYVVVAVDSEGRRSPSSAPAPVGSRYTLRDGTTTGSRTSVQSETFQEDGRGVTLSGTVTMDADEGVSASGTVTDSNGRELGTFTQTPTTSGTTTTFNPTYGNPSMYSTDRVNATELAPGVDGADVVRSFPPKPAPPTTPPGPGVETPRPTDEPKCGEGSMDAAASSGNC